MSKNKHIIQIIQAIYSEENIIVTRNSAPIKEVTDNGIILEPNQSIFTDYVPNEHINIAKSLWTNMDTISILLFSYNMSEFQINSELRRIFLKTLDEQSLKIEKLIRNFEESFKNAKK